MYVSTMLSKWSFWCTLYLLTLKILTSSKSIQEEELRYKTWKFKNSEGPVVSMTIAGGDLTLLDSQEKHLAFTWQGFIQGTTSNEHKTSFRFKCKAPYPIKWYIRTTYGKQFWGPDSQEYQNPLQTNITLNGLDFTYESEVYFNWTYSVLVKCFDVNNPNILSMYDSYCDKVEVEDIEDGGPFENNYEDNVKMIELRGTRANLLQWITADPKWVKWQGGMDNWPLILLPCPVRDHSDKAVLKYKPNDKYVRLPPKSEKNFEWNPKFGFVLRKEADRENYSTWKNTIFRCQVEYSYVTVEPLDLDYPIVVVDEDKNNNTSWPFQCSMKNQSENNLEFIESKGGTMRQESLQCESIRSCEVEPLQHIIKDDATTDCNPKDGVCSGKNILKYGKVLCLISIPIKDWHVYDKGLSRLFFRGLDEKIYVLPTMVPPDAVIRISGGGIKVTKDAPHEIICTTVTYFLKPIVRFAVKLADGSSELLPQRMGTTNNSTKWSLSRESSILEVTVQVYVKAQYRSITCFSPQQNTSEWWNATTRFTQFKEKSVNIVVPSVVTSCTFIILILLLTLFVIKYRQAKEKLRNLTPEEVAQFFEGSCSEFDKQNDQNVLDGIQNLDARPFTMQINSSDISIDFRSLLGKGEFGLVYKGMFLGMPVAVKTMKPSADIGMFKSILEEVKIMEYVGRHPNIVTFCGAEVSNIINKEIWIILEFSPKGCLLEYLRSFHQTSVLEVSENTKYGYCIPTKILNSWCEQIAYAMQFLEQLGV